MGTVGVAGLALSFQRKVNIMYFRSCCLKSRCVVFYEQSFDLFVAYNERQSIKGDVCGAVCLKTCVGGFIR